MEIFIFDNQYKAIDLATWLNFIDGSTEYGVYVHYTGLFEVKEVDSKRRKSSLRRVAIPKNYAQMSYEHIQSICHDKEPLIHIESIRGMFSLVNSQVLRFVLKQQIPLQKFIRMELANRGYDDTNAFVGFKQAEKVWLK